MRTRISIVGTLILMLVFSSSGAAFAQLMPARRTAISLTATPVAGTTGFSTHLSYRLNDHWDFLVGEDSVAGLSLFSLGGRYYLPSTAPTVRSYLTVEFMSAGTGTGSLVGAGFSIALSPTWTGFGTVGLVSGPGGSTTGYDVGIQYSISQQFSLIVGTSNVFTSGGVYFGTSIGLPGQ